MKILFSDARKLSTQHRMWTDKHQQKKEEYCNRKNNKKSRTHMRYCCCNNLCINTYTIWATVFYAVHPSWSSIIWSRLYVEHSHRKGSTICVQLNDICHTPTNIPETHIRLRLPQSKLYFNETFINYCCNHKFGGRTIYSAVGCRAFHPSWFIVFRLASIHNRQDFWI